MDNSRVDKIIQYSLLVAGEEDDFRDRQLGPIHLIKYVYLADLFYAKSNKGNIFTGVKWQFYKFGPWSQAVNQRIEPALLCIDVDKKTFPSNYGDKEEWVRWMATDTSPITNLERELPFVITANIRRVVHDFGQATPDLLAYVYNTTPMLSAAPNEYLDFSNVSSNKLKPLEKEPNVSLSKKKQKQLKAKMKDLRSLSKKKLADRRKQTLVKPPITPRYDDVYFEGIDWLDSLAGVPLEEGSKEAIFSDAIWKSPSRRGDDASN